MIYNGALDTVGNTPLIYFGEEDELKIYVKYEGVNPTGSVKDRAAKYVIDKSLEKNIITQETKIIESSSGNFGIALSAYCNKVGLNSTIVIDPNILPINEYMIRQLADEVVKVENFDETGGYLLNRRRYIMNQLKENRNYYWINQYENKDIAQAYYETVGEEICNEVKVDYIFIGVSSGGTIAGVSNKVKERYPNAKVIAVDIEGSVIFGGLPKKRFIPGIGSSMCPSILKFAQIDDVVIVREEDSISECRAFINKHAMLIGGSSGAVFNAISKYFKNNQTIGKKNVVALFADCGDRYADTIYQNDWVEQKYMSIV